MSSVPMERAEIARRMAQSGYHSHSGSTRFMQKQQQSGGGGKDEAVDEARAQGGRGDPGPQRSHYAQSILSPAFGATPPPRPLAPVLTPVSTTKGDGGDQHSYFVEQPTFAPSSPSRVPPPAPDPHRYNNAATERQYFVDVSPHRAGAGDVGAYNQGPSSFAPLDSSGGSHDHVVGSIFQRCAKTQPVETQLPLRGQQSNENVHDSIVGEVSSIYGDAPQADPAADPQHDPQQRHDPQQHQDPIAPGSTYSVFQPPRDQGRHQGIGVDEGKPKPPKKNGVSEEISSLVLDRVLSLRDVLEEVERKEMIRITLAALLERRVATFTDKEAEERSIIDRTEAACREVFFRALDNIHHMLQPLPVTSSLSRPVVSNSLFKHPAASATPVAALSPPQQQQQQLMDYAAWDAVLGSGRNDDKKSDSVGGQVRALHMLEPKSSGQQPVSNENWTTGEDRQGVPMATSQSKVGSVGAGGSAWEDRVDDWDFAPPGAEGSGGPKAGNTTTGDGTPPPDPVGLPAPLSSLAQKRQLVLNNAPQEDHFLNAPVSALTQHSSADDWNLSPLTTTTKGNTGAALWASGNEKDGGGGGGDDLSYQPVSAVDNVKAESGPKVLQAGSKTGGDDEDLLSALPLAPKPEPLKGDPPAATRPEANPSAVAPPSAAPAGAKKTTPELLINTKKDEATPTKAAPHNSRDPPSDDTFTLGSDLGTTPKVTPEKNVDPTPNPQPAAAARPPSPTQSSSSVWSSSSDGGGSVVENQASGGEVEPEPTSSAVAMPQILNVLAVPSTGGGESPGPLGGFLDPHGSSTLSDGNFGRAPPSGDNTRPPSVTGNAQGRMTPHDIPGPSATLDDPGDSSDDDSSSEILLPGGYGAARRN